MIELAYALRDALLELKDWADSESMNPGDEFYRLLDVYHRNVDPSWQPGGYGMATRDPSIPIVVDMSSMMLLESDRSALTHFLGGLKDA